MIKDEKMDIVRELEGNYTTIRGISTNLAVEAKQYTKAVEIPIEYQRHAKVFSEEESNRFPPKRPWDHAINFKPGSPDSTNCKVYPTMQKEREYLQTWLDDMLKKKFINHANPNFAYHASTKRQ
jgi:hypothetical protein